MYEISIQLSVLMKIISYDYDFGIFSNLLFFLFFFYLPLI